jgi:hypothetical protein
MGLWKDPELFFSGRFLYQNGVGRISNLLNKVAKKGKTIRKKNDFRIDVERLLGSPIYLQLWVKVKKDWRDRK